MRLIETTTLEMCEFFPPHIPPYAILSHTWGAEEVSLMEYPTSEGRAKRGFRKIRGSAALAKKLKHKYIWVDTCCIDKTSSADLTEAINSMYQWYRDATICFAFLEDLPFEASNKYITACRWFTRGWTLQELVAPRHLDFYDANWVYRGSKMDHLDAIYKRTNIPRRILLGQEHPTSYSLARRMSWAASRETTRTEDTAYCLLGIFDINMPLAYGEGTKAFRRLQEEIVKKNSDLTIFAWGSPGTVAPSKEQPKEPATHLTESKPVFQPSFAAASSFSPPGSPRASPMPPSSSEKKIPSSVSPASSTASGASKRRARTELCLFAPSPAPFSDNASLHPFADDFENFTVTNRGLFVSGSVYLRLVQHPSSSVPGATVHHYLLLVGSQFGKFVGIYLLKIGPNLFQRDWDADMAVLRQEDVLLMRGFLVTDWYILIDKRPANAITPETFRQMAVRMPAHGGDNRYIMLKDTAPTHLWDIQDRVFVRPKAYAWSRYDMVLAMKCAVALRDTNEKAASRLPDDLVPSKRVHFVVLCHYRFHQQEPRFVVFLEEDYPHETEMLLLRRSPDNSFMWPDLEVICPRIAALPDHVMVDVGSKGWRGGRGKSCWYRVSITAKKEKVDLDYAETELYNVYFDIRQTDNGDAEKPASAKKTDKPEKNGKAERAERQQKTEKVENTERWERTERTEKSERAERAEKSPRPDKVERAEKTDKSPRPDSRKTTS